MEDSPETILYKTVEEGVKRMKNGQTAIYTEDQSLRRYYKNNPEEVRPMIVPSEDHNSVGIENLAFTENSPLVPFFVANCMDLYQNGIINILERKWMGKKLGSKVDTNLHTVRLNLGQMMLIFSILGAATVTAVMVLGIELTWNWINKKTGKNVSMSVINEEPNGTQ